MTAGAYTPTLDELPALSFPAGFLVYSKDCNANHSPHGWHTGILSPRDLVVFLFASLSLDASGLLRVKQGIAGVWANTISLLLITCTTCTFLLMSSCLFRSLHVWQPWLGLANRMAIAGILFCYVFSIVPFLFECQGSLFYNAVPLCHQQRVIFYPILVLMIASVFWGVQQLSLQSKLPLW